MMSKESKRNYKIDQEWKARTAYLMKMEGHTTAEIMEFTGIKKAKHVPSIVLRGERLLSI